MFLSTIRRQGICSSTMPEGSPATSARSVQLLSKGGKSPAAEFEELKERGSHGNLPNYGKAYLSHLIGEFNTLRTICKDDEANELAQEVVTRAEDPKTNTMTWRDAYMLDTAIAEMLPDGILASTRMVSRSQV